MPLSMIDMKKTGDNIRDLCERRNISVKEIHAALGVSSQAVYKWFRGESVPSIDNLVALADMLDVSVSDIIVTCSDEV
ncbi:MAG: helix-turn-helix transcriptional regulator [Clostridiales bacterium]|nr:helix-turn-helix transcriptional regulator [Clostridiales bacterium]